jgi:putative spermidine/putrescine transport system permease protein
MVAVTAGAPTAAPSQVRHARRGVPWGRWLVLLLAGVYFGVPLYAVLAMPFAYRSLDAGLRAIPLTTLVEASRSLGGGWGTTLVRVLLPNLHSALLSATVLTVALVLGEFTMASLDQYETFPVWIVVFDQDDAHVSVAVSLLSLVITWVLLLLISLIDTRRLRRSGDS